MKCLKCDKEVGWIDQLYNLHKCVIMKEWKPTGTQEDHDDSVKKNIEWFHEKGVHYPYNDSSHGVAFHQLVYSYVNRNFEFRNVLTVLMWEISKYYPGSVEWDMHQKITYEYEDRKVVITFGQLGIDWDKNIKITIIHDKIYSCHNIETVIKIVRGIIDTEVADAN